LRQFIINHGFYQSQVNHNARNAKFDTVSLSYGRCVACVACVSCLYWLPTICFRGGSRILQGRVSNPSERGTGGRAPKGAEGGRGLCPLVVVVVVVVVNDSYSAAPYSSPDRECIRLQKSKSNIAEVSFEFALERANREFFVCISYIKMVSFYAFLLIFIDAVFFSNEHPNQKCGCLDTLDTPWIRPVLAYFSCVACVPHFHQKNYARGSIAWDNILPAGVCRVRGEPSRTATSRPGHGPSAAQSPGFAGRVHAAWPARRLPRRTSRSRLARSESQR